MRLKQLTVAVAIALIFPPSMQAHAQQSAPVSLPEVEVPANAVVEAVRVDPFSNVSAVITEDQLRDQNALDLGSALRRTPGVQISRYNPVGAFGGDQGGAIFIRGMGISRPGTEIKTYVDGIPLYMGLWNHPLLDLLPINGMDSITVYKSPQLNINGNNFASVNLQTKRATKEGLHGSARITVGQYNTLTEQVDLQGKHGDWDYTLAQGHAKSDGHRPHANGELNNAAGSLNFKLNEHWLIGGSFVVVDNQASDPGDNRSAAPTVAPQYNTQASLFSLGLQHQHGDWQGSLKLYTSSGEGNWLNQPAPDGDTLSNFSMSGMRWKENFSPWRGGKIQAGLDFDQWSGDAQFNRIGTGTPSSYQGPSFKVTSPYVTVSQNMELNSTWMLVPSVGVRWYDHSKFESKAAPQLGLSLVSDQLTLFANASRGINYPGLEAPLLSSLIPALDSTWQQLSAEELKHLEVGVQWSPGANTEINLSVFEDEVSNRYVFAFPPTVSSPEFLNLGQYRMRGTELSIRQNFTSKWSIFAGITVLDPSINNLPYTPEQAATLGVNGQVGPLRVAFDAQYQSDVWALNRSRNAASTNTEQVNGFTVTNARVAYPLPSLGKKGELFLAIENLFDRDYAYRPGYPMPGRWAQVGLGMSF
jgi:outer membrane cobalamin receptor